MRGRCVIPWGAVIGAAGAIGGALISSGSDQQTQSYQPPPKFQQAYNQTLDQANAVASTPYQPYSGAVVAGFTPAQLEAFNSVNASKGLANPYLNNASAATQQVQKNPISGQVPTLSKNAAGTLASSAANTYTQPAPNYLSSAAQAFPLIMALMGNPGGGLGTNPMDVSAPTMPGYNQPANLPGQTNNLIGTDVPTATSGIQQYMDPYTQQVIDATQAQFNNQNEQQRQQLIGNAISAGAFGGDRAGVAQAALAGQQNLAQAPVIADLYSKGYGQALSAAQQDQQVALQKLGMGGQYGNLGLGFDQATNDAIMRMYGLETGFGLQQQNQLGQLGLGAQQLQSTSGLGALDAIMGGLQAQESGTLARAQGASGMYNQNAGTALQGATATANQQLAAAQQQANLGNSALENELKQAQAQLSAGTMQQQLAQNQLNAAYQQYKESTAYPVEMTEWLANITTQLGGAAGGLGVTTTPTGNPVSGAIGGGLAASQLANNLGYMQAPAKAVYDPETGNYTPGPGGFARGGPVDHNDRLDTLKAAFGEYLRPTSAPAAPGDVAGNGEVYTPALGDVLPGSPEAQGLGRHFGRGRSERDPHDRGPEWRRHFGDRRDDLIERFRNRHGQQPGAPASAAPATPGAAAPVALPPVDPYANLGFQYAPGPFNASNVLGDGGGGGGGLPAIPALSSGTPGSTLSVAPTSNYSLPALPATVQPYGNWTPPPPQTPGVQAAYNAPGNGPGNNSPLQDIAQALAAGTPVSAQSWALGGYTPGGTSLLNGTTPANARVRPFAEGGPVEPQGNINQFDSLLPDSPWPDMLQRRQMWEANSVLSHIAAAGAAAWERVKQGNPEKYDVDAVETMWLRGQTGGYDDAEDLAMKQFLIQQGRVRENPQEQVPGRAPGGNLGVGFFDAPNLPEGPGFSRFNVADLINEEKRQQAATPFQQLMRRSEENSWREPADLGASPTQIAGTDAGSQGLGGALNRMMDNPEQMSLFLAGLGMLGGRSTSAGQNIAQGAMQGVGYLQNRRDQDANRAERAEERAQRTRQIDIAERNATAEADRMAKEIARWDRLDTEAERQHVEEGLDKAAEFIDRDLARTGTANFQRDTLNRQTIKDELDAERTQRRDESEADYRERMAGVAEKNADAGRFSYVGTDPDGKPIFLDARTGQTTIGDVKIGAKPSSSRTSALETNLAVMRSIYPNLTDPERYEKLRTAVKNPNERTRMLQTEVGRLRAANVDISGRPTMTEAELLAQANTNITEMDRSLNSQPGAANPAAPNPAPITAPGPGAGVVPPRPSNVPATAQYSPSQKSWWWQEDGQWKSAPGA